MKRPALLFQENDKTVGKDCHSNKEIGKGQSVTGTPNFPCLPVVSIEQNGVLKVTL